MKILKYAKSWYSWYMGDAKSEIKTSSYSTTEAIHQKLLAEFLSSQSAPEIHRLPFRSEIIGLIKIYKNSTPQSSPTFFPPNVLKHNEEKVNTNFLKMIKEFSQ